MITINGKCSIHIVCRVLQDKIRILESNIVNLLEQTSRVSYWHTFVKFSFLIC